MRSFRPQLRPPRLPSKPSPVLLRRHASTLPRDRPSFLRRNRLPLALSTLALTAGLGAGFAITHTLAPPPLPAAGTREDGVLVADLEARIDEAFTVKVLRGKCLGVARQLRSGDGEGEGQGWVELVPAGRDADPAPPRHLLDDERRMLSHLRGARATGVERVFWDRGSGKVVAVVWFGGGVAGWPGVTHGGMLATALVEKLALADHLALHGAEEQAGGRPLAGTGKHARVPIPGGVVEAPRQPEELSLTYKRPTFANEFYVVRVTPAWRTGMGKEEEAKGRVGMALPVRDGADWEASIETMDQKPCVLAQARFAPSGSLIHEAERRVVETTRRSYAEFKDWLWPSRQKESQIG